MNRPQDCNRGEPGFLADRGTVATMRTISTHAGQPGRGARPRVAEIRFGGPRHCPPRPRGRRPPPAKPLTTRRRGGRTSAGRLIDRGRAGRHRACRAARSPAIPRRRRAQLYQRRYSRRRRRSSRETSRGSDAEPPVAVPARRPDQAPERRRRGRARLTSMAPSHDVILACAVSHG